MKTQFYSGIGSRKTPDDILKLFFSLGKILAHMGFILRSGGADGADKAFESGCDSIKGKKEIHLPFKNFNLNNSIFHNPSPLAIEIAKEYHPAWDNCSDFARLAHGRNSHIILGCNLQSPSEFVICWTPETGGTMQGIRVANGYKIPVINLYNHNDLNTEKKILNHLGIRRFKLWKG